MNIGSDRNALLIKTRDLMRNGSGYMDPTAYAAIKRMDDVCEVKEIDHKEGVERFQSVLKDIFKACEDAGFHLEERVVIKDKKTGKVWR